MLPVCLWGCLQRITYLRRFLGGFIRLIEMLRVCRWGCLQRMYYLHVFLGCFIRLIEMLRVCRWGCLQRIYYLQMFLGCFIRLIEMLRVCRWGCLQIIYYLHVFLERFYTLNWNAACVSLGLSAENVVFAYVFKGFIRLIEMMRVLRVCRWGCLQIMYCLQFF